MSVGRSLTPPDSFFNLRGFFWIIDVNSDRVLDFPLDLAIELCSVSSPYHLGNRSHRLIQFWFTAVSLNHWCAFWSCPRFSTWFRNRTLFCSKSMSVWESLTPSDSIQIPVGPLFVSFKFRMGFFSVFRLVWNWTNFFWLPLNHR